MTILLRHRIRQVARLGIVAATRLVWNRIVRRVVNYWQRSLALVSATGLSTCNVEEPPLRIVPVLSLPQDGAMQAWCSHVFDLLGSGPIEMRLLLDDPISDLPRAWHSRFRSLHCLLPEGYKLIDWQLDPKSGFRWSARHWSRGVQYGLQAGVEIKWPWELSRLQHLPCIAGRISTASPNAQIQLGKELQAQIIDFVMQNPPGFGVNWICAMDVGIRVANIGLAVDLARAAGAQFDRPFLALLSATLRDHGRFLVRNLEWNATLCSNHYLANVVGLLFAGAYLTPDKETIGWLTFAGREVVSQLREQFHPDGTNFEASTCYHRLSGEMLVYGSALMLHLAEKRPTTIAAWYRGSVPRFHPAPYASAIHGSLNATGAHTPFDISDLRRLAGIGLFTHSLLRRDESVPQIGDNDNGRFVRFMYGGNPYEDILRHAHLPQAVAALFGEISSTGESMESEWLRRWTGRSKLTISCKLPAPDSLYIAYPYFGLWIWNRGRFRVTLRCGSVGQNGNGGHAHCDQLAITLDVDGSAVIIDAGTGVYTPNPETRNQFRSVASHSTIIVPNREPAEWLPGRWGLFAMKEHFHAKVIDSGPNGATALHYGYGEPVSRRLLVDDGMIEIVDHVPAALDGSFARFILAYGIESQIKGKDCRLKMPRSDAAVLISSSEHEFWVDKVNVSAYYGVSNESLAVCVRSRKLRITLI